MTGEKMAGEKVAPATGGKDTTLALVAYVLTWLTGLLVFVIAKDKFAKFHGMQALILGILGLVLGFVTFGLGSILLWIYGLYVGVVYAYKGQMYKIPYIGDYAEKYAS